MIGSGLVIYGAGGHGKVIADIVRCHSGGRLIGFIDDGKSGEWCGIPILGGRDHLRDSVEREHRILLGIGENRIRRELFELVRGWGFELGTAIHPSAQLGSDVRIEPGTVAMANTAVNAGTRIGWNAIVNTGATIDHDCEIGDYAHISPGVHLAGGVTVGAMSHLGIGASVVPGVTIGEGVLLGAGAVAVRDLPDGVTAAGVPARILDPAPGVEDGHEG